MKIEDGTETLNINSSYSSLLTLHIVHYSLKCLSFCTAWLENTCSTFRFHYIHTNLSHTHTCLHTLGYNRSLYTLRSFQQILKCVSWFIMKVCKYAYSLRQRILSLEWTPVSQHFYVAITVFVFRAKSDGFRSTSRNEPSLRMNSNGTFTTNTSRFKSPYGEVGTNRDSSMIASFVLPHDRTAFSGPLHLLNFILYWGISYQGNRQRLTWKMK